jgi:hypothetical protein
MAMVTSPVNSNNARTGPLDWKGLVRCFAVRSASRPGYCREWGRSSVTWVTGISFFRSLPGEAGKAVLFKDIKDMAFVGFRGDEKRSGW